MQLDVYTRKIEVEIRKISEICSQISEVKQNIKAQQVSEACHITPTELPALISELTPRNHRTRSWSGLDAQGSPTPPRILTCR